MHKVLRIHEESCDVYVLISFILELPTTAPGKSGAHAMFTTTSSKGRC